MKIEGHIEEIEFDEPQEGTPPAPREHWLRTALRSRRLRIGGALAAVAILAGAAVLVPWAHPNANPTPSSSPSENPSEIAAASPEETSLPTPTPESTWNFPVITADPNDTPAPIVTPPLPPAFTSYGWPATLDTTDGSGLSGTPAVVGPDGTTYLNGFPPLDKTGHARKGWAQLPDGSYLAPFAFGSDGTAYVQFTPGYNDVAPPTEVYAFDAKGELKTGWPVYVDAPVLFEPGPSGSLYAIAGYGDSKATVTVYSPQGTSKAHWSIPYFGTSCGQTIRSDGTLFLAYAPADATSTCVIGVHGPTGERLSEKPAGSWAGLEIAHDGTVVAWGYDMAPYSSSIVAQTRVAIIGTDGLPVSGWPATFEGAASAPAIGPDGTIYVTSLGLGTSPSKVIALGPTGATKPGWPASLPAGYGPMVGGVFPIPPVPGDGGTVYTTALDRNGMGYVTAFDASGAVVPGWPYSLPKAFAQFYDQGGWVMTPQPVGAARAASLSIASTSGNPGPIFVRPPSGNGLLYLALEDRIVALGADGGAAPGWPHLLSGKYAKAGWVDLERTPDGGVVAIAFLQTAPQDPNDPTVQSWFILRWAPSGAISK